MTERIKTWKVQQGIDGIVLTINGKEYVTTSGASLAFDIEQAAKSFENLTPVWWGYDGSPEVGRIREAALVDEACPGFVYAGGKRGSGLVKQRLVESDSIEPRD